MNCQPLRDDIMVYAVPRGDIEGTSFIIKENPHREENQWFKVFATGPKVRDIGVGDVVFIPWARITPPQYMDVDGEERQVGVTSEMEVLAVLEK